MFLGATLRLSSGTNAPKPRCPPKEDRKGDSLLKSCCPRCSRCPPKGDRKGDSLLNSCCPRCSRCPPKGDRKSDSLLNRCCPRCPPCPPKGDRKSDSLLNRCCPRCPRCPPKGDRKGDSLLKSCCLRCPRSQKGIPKGDSPLESPSSRRSRADQAPTTPSEIEKSGVATANLAIHCVQAQYIWRRRERLARLEVRVPRVQWRRHSVSTSIGGIPC